MSPLDLSPAQMNAVRAAFAYWVPRWDWEMPTLTGVSLEEFEEAAEAWPCVCGPSQTALLAALGAVRELWGAELDTTDIVGIDHNEMGLLVQLLAKAVDDAV